MRRLFLLIFTVSGLFFALDAQVLKGKIMDDMTGNPVSDASILLIPGNSGTHAHPDGSYQLTPAAGTYLLEVNHLGYYPENRRITLRSNDTLVVDFLLKAKIFEQEQVVITANKVERERMAVPMNVSVLTSGIIAESHESNILPVISGEIPGLFITERGLAGFGLAGGSAGKISIRGVGGSDASFPVLLLIDGQPQFMGLMGHPIPDSYVSGDVEKVEVVKGPASILYGTNAMGGAINLITRKQTEEGFDLNARFTGGSYGTLKGHGSAGFSKKGLGILASYQHDQTDGHRPGSAFRLDNGNLRVNYALSKLFSMDATLNRSSFKGYDPGSIYGNSADYANNSHWVDIVRSNGYLSFSNHTGIAEGGVKAYISSGDHSIYDGWTSEDENRGFSIFQSIRLFSGNLVSAGYDRKKYGGRGNSPTLGNKNGQYLSVEEQGAYLMVDQRLLQKISLNAGLRWDHHSGFGDTWVPQFGATYGLKGNTSFKALVSKGFRNPSIRELYLFPTANPDLRPERMWNHELSWMQRFAGDKIATELTAYLIRGENLILLVPNSSSPPPMKNQNSGDFRHNGLEFSIKYSPSGSITLNGAYSYLHMDAPKISAPVHQLMAGAHYRVKLWSGSLRLRHYEKLYTMVTPQNTTTESFTLLSADVTYRISKWLSVSLSGENLLNQKYQMQYGYPMPGATFFGGLSIRI